jgi:hypothetical protein
MGKIFKKLRKTIENQYCIPKSVKSRYNLRVGKKLPYPYANDNKTL